MKFKLEKIAGDASFRCFYRLILGNRTSIIVDSKKEKFKNLIKYSIVNNFLRERGILTPRLFNSYFNQGLIEVEDFGDISFNKYLKKRKKYLAYKKVIDLLIKLQKIKVRRKINLSKNNWIKLDFYNQNNLHKESDLFFKWYLVGVVGKKKSKKYKILIKKELNKIYKKINLENNYFVHRDFHASNFMVIKNKIGLIDTQDAIIGNPAYDLASLVDDVRVNIPLKLKKKIFNYYLQKTSKRIKKKKNQLINDFNIFSIQRNLKILGIFYRLFKRDQKRQYLKFIPYTWELIELRLENDLFKNLKLLIDDAVSKKMRKKKLFQ